MEDFHEAGGVDAVMRSLAARLDLSATDVTGRSLAERLARPPATGHDDQLVRPLDRPINATGGLIIVRGSLAPDGAVLKRAAATPALLEHEGRAVVFSFARRSRPPHRRSGPRYRGDDVMVLQNAGPRSPAAMPEAGYLPIPRKLAAKGVNDMVRISDARMSGTAFGTIVLHVTPEAAVGGPLALVRSGDRIRLSAREKRLDLLVATAELDRRRSAPCGPGSRTAARLFPSVLALDPRRPPKAAISTSCWPIPAPRPSSRSRP